LQLRHSGRGLWRRNHQFLWCTCGEHRSAGGSRGSGGWGCHSGDKCVAWLGNGTGLPRVFFGYLYPYPLKPVPILVGQVFPQVLVRVVSGLTGMRPAAGMQRVTHISVYIHTYYIINIYRRASKYARSPTHLLPLPPAPCHSHPLLAIPTRSLPFPPALSHSLVGTPSCLIGDTSEMALVEVVADTSGVMVEVGIW
jgi:hypothetical protein